jgi:hypothetical protein
LIFTAVYIGDSCTIAYPASSSHVVFSNYSNSPSHSCFLRTDTGVAATLSGSLGSGDLLVRGPARSTHFDSRSPFPDEGALVTEFHSIRFFNNGDNASNVDIEFAGGSSEFEFSSVTVGSADGVFGSEQYWRFDPLFEEPDYPTIGASTVGIVLGILGAFAIVFLMIGLGIGVRAYLTRRKEEPLPEPLFDAQMGHHHPRTKKKPRRVPGELEEAVTDEELPSSPYDFECPSL